MLDFRFSWGSLWVTTPCSSETAQMFQEEHVAFVFRISFLTYISTLKIEATCTLETLANFQQAYFMLASCLDWS
jgi:hypothetical protein